jgi:amidohydrolase
MTSHIIVALQQLVSRNANSAVPTVLSFGKVVADGATNVIPQEARVEGTFRTMNENWRDIAHGRIREIAQGVASSMGGECVVEIKKGYPFLVNHQETTMFAAGKATDLLGKENVASLDLRMTAEDFSYFSQMYPSVFYRLGIQSPGKEPTSLHSPFFFADEDALKTGMKTMAYIAYEYLNNEKY